MTQTVGQYEIRDLLGEGGIGQVHAAFDTVLQREVAMKSLRPELLSDANFVDRFRAEATSLARLNHPNITTLYSLIPDGKNLYMVMELVRGHTLDDILAKRNAPLDVRESLAIIAQAADGLAYAHSMGVIHRDIKPSNLMVAENGVLKIMDFGIARVRGSQRLTRSGSIVGTLAYMAPEQLRGEEGDEACDLYSLAIVLYEMLTGTPPFSANSEYDLMQAQINQKPDRLISRVPGLDAKVESAIMKALSKKPGQRFASTRAFSDALGASSLRMDAPKILHNDTRLIETPSNPIQIAPPRRSAFDRLPNIPGLAPELRAAVYGGGAAAVVALAVIAALFLHSPSPPPPPSIAVNSPGGMQTPSVPPAVNPQTPKVPPAPAPSPANPAEAAALAGPLASTVAAANRGDPTAQNELGVKYAARRGRAAARRRQSGRVVSQGREPGTAQGANQSRRHVFLRPRRAVAKLSRRAVVVSQSRAAGLAGCAIPARLHVREGPGHRQGRDQSRAALSQRRRARLSRGAEFDGHPLRHRQRRRHRKTTSRRSTGTRKRPIRVSPRRRRISATCISSATASTRTMPRRWRGTAKPPTSNSPTPNSGSASCMKKD